MKVKKELLAVAPVFEAHGFSSEIYADATAIFKRYDDCIRFSFDRPSCPPELFPKFVKLLETTGPRLPPPVIRTNCHVRVGSNYYSIETKLFDMPLQGAYFYTTQEELRQAVKKLTDQAINVILPYAEDLVEYGVYPTRELYERLSQYKTDRYAHLQATEETLQRVRTTIGQWIPQTQEQRYEAFEARIDDIIDLVYQLGEAVIHTYGGSWEWKTWRRYINSYREYDEMREYCPFLPVEGDDYDQWFNPLNIITRHWNFYNVLPQYEFNSMESFKYYTWPGAIIK